MDVDIATRVARLRMDQHGLGPWTLRLTRAIREFGWCRYDIDPVTGESCGRPGEIVLSRAFVVLNNRQSVEQLVLHEIAHALSLTGRHDAAFRSMCQQIGCHVVEAYVFGVVPRARYRTTCSRCGTKDDLVRLGGRSVRKCTHCGHRVVFRDSGRGRKM